MKSIVNLYSGFFCADAKASDTIGSDLIPDAIASVSFGFDLSYPKLKHRVLLVLNIPRLKPWDICKIIIYIS